jgi:hypothetical protein
VAGRYAYVIVGLAAVLALVVLSGIAPYGDAWVWFEFPRRITFVAAALGLWACTARSREWAGWMVLGTAAVSLAWTVIDEYVGLAHYGRTDLLGSEFWLLFELAVVRLAPWLVGGLYGVLALLAITARGDHRDRARAGAWLVAVSALALGFTLASQDWFTLDNLTQPGTSISSTAWPDTKVLSVVVDGLAAAAGAVLMLTGRRRTEDRIPRATVRGRLQ